MAYERCVIFGAGEYYEGPAPAIEKGMLAIAADGGLDHMRAMGLSPDFVIGDFDSLSGDVPDSDRSVRLPPQKDDPDLLSALKVGWSRGAREFHIYGALGGRIDHTIANAQLMALLASHGGIGYLYGDGSIVTAIADGALEFPANHVAPRRMISVFSHSDVCHGVTIAGLKYVLEGAALANTVVQGVSNEFVDGSAATVSVESGTLIVTFPIEAPLPAVRLRHPFGGDLGALDTAVSSALAVR